MPRVGVLVPMEAPQGWGRVEESVFKKIDELPYVIGLIKQSLSKQLSNS